VLGPLAEVRRMVQEEAIDEVVVTPEAGDRLRWLVGELLDLPVHVRVVPECFTLALDRPRIEDFAGVPMVDLRAGPLSDTQRLVKRLLDLALGSLLLVVALPVMGIIALAIKLDSPGPVLLRQPRVGENGRLFTMYKFRSMVQNAEALQALVTTRDAQGRLIHKRPDDPRVTRVGRFLRRTSLDELPQLFNVLKGEMSLVGPRPELPWIVAQYEPWQRRRLVVPQGLTGWWQVNGRGEKLMHLHTDADLYYITNYSLWLDLRILWKTVWVVLQGKGAY
jgi:exopolysaccharide biosynthesis polyprenyl glycosylphosphotransferase